MSETSEGQSFTQEDLEARVAEEVANLKGALQKERDSRREARAENAELKEALGALTAQVQELQHQQKGSEAGMDKDALKKLRADLRADIERDYAPKLDELAEVRAMYEAERGKSRTLMLDNVVKSKMAKAGARADRIDALFKLTADRYDLTDDGEPILKDSREVPLDKFLGESLAAEFPEFYNGSGSSGGGASKSAGGAGGRVRTVAADDNAAFIANLDGIAKGEVEVR